MKRSVAWLLGAVLLAGCATTTTGPGVVPASPLLRVPMSLRASSYEEQQHLAQLELKQDWPAIASIASGRVAQDATDADWRLVMGYALLQQRNFEAAIGALRPVVETHPEEVDGHNLLGEALRLSGQRSEARRVLERASYVHPNSHVTRFLLGELYREDDLLERARSAYETSVHLEPEFSPAWLGLTRVLARTGPRDAYEAALKNLKALDPEMAKAALELDAPRPVKPVPVR